MFLIFFFYRVTDFAYFGTSTTDADGKFDFTTYRPGIYPSRPITHIHYKVWYQGEEVLTSQFYFTDEGYRYDPMLMLDVTYMPDGNSYVEKTVVVDLGNGGWEKLTPWQQEGPFYPVVSFFSIGNDLTQGIGEFGTLFPSFDNSGTWDPTNMTDTFEPTASPTNNVTADIGDGGANSTDIGNSTDVEGDVPTQAPTTPVNQTSTASPTITSPPVEFANFTIPPQQGNITLNVTISPTSSNETNVTQFPTISPTLEKEEEDDKKDKDDDKEEVAKEKDAGTATRRMVRHRVAY